MWRYLLAAAGILASTEPLASGPVLDRIMADRQIKLGVRADAPPFSALVDGWPTGFSVDLCSAVAAAISEVSDVEEMEGALFVVDTANRFDALQAGEIDVLCGATTATLRRREIVSFTIPTFATGVGAVIRADAPDVFKKVLVTGGPEALAETDGGGDEMAGAIFGVRDATTASDWLETGPLLSIGNLAIKTLRDHKTGIEAVAAGSFKAYFADRAILLGLTRDHPRRDELLVSDAAFTYEPYALAIPRGDEDLRLLLDRTLSHLYQNGEILKLYEAHFGPAGADIKAFYRYMILPE